MDQVETLCNKVFLMNLGKEVLSGDVASIREAHAENAVIIESDADLTDHPAVERFEEHGLARKVWLREGELPEPFVASLLAKGATLKRYERALPSLEEVFVKVVKS